MCSVCREEHEESEIYPNNNDKREIMSLKITTVINKRRDVDGKENQGRENTRDLWVYVDVLCEND